jgi:hypothetical protein
VRINLQGSYDRVNKRMWRGRKRRKRKDRACLRLDQTSQFFIGFNWVRKTCRDLMIRLTKECGEAGKGEKD